MGNRVNTNEKKYKTAVLVLNAEKNFEVKCPYCKTLIKGLLVFFEDNVFCSRCKQGITISDSNGVRRIGQPLRPGMYLGRVGPIQVRIKLKGGSC